MTVKEIVTKHLQDNGYDGLFNEDNDCMCIQGALNPCNKLNLYCEPGYKVLQDDGDWLIQKEKP